MPDDDRKWFLRWRHKNGRTYERKLRSKTFRVPKNAVDWQVVCRETNLECG